ncbi:regulator of chromosome condensation 1/beta-lactamase-inhibitor protein II, partial [Baffinella frigidus]
SCGNGHCCLLFPCQGKVKCWGRGSNGELMSGTTNDIAKAIDFGGSYYPIEIFRSACHLCTCARMQTGDIKCWGHNNYGQLGYGDTLNRGDTESTMGDDLPVVDMGTNYVTSLSCSRDTRCALLDNNKVVCWGKNTVGETGTGTNALVLSPGQYVLLGSTPRINKLKSSSGGTYAIFSDGTFKCWGDNYYGQLGYGDTVRRGNTAISMGDNLPFVSLEVPVVDLEIFYLYGGTCFLVSDGRIKCWGKNTDGTLGQGTSTS